MAATVSPRTRPTAPRSRPPTRRAAPPRRVAARSFGPRRGASRVRWDRVGRTALVLVLGFVLFSYLNPAINFVQSHRQTTEAKAELRQLQAENRSLHNRVQSAGEARVLEREARLQGMIAAGERPYVVHGLGG